MKGVTSGKLLPAYQSPQASLSPSAPSHPHGHGAIQDGEASDADTHVDTLMVGMERKMPLVVYLLVTSCSGLLRSVSRTLAQNTTRGPNRLGNK